MQSSFLSPSAIPGTPQGSALQLASDDNGPLDKRGAVRLPTASLLAHLADLTASQARVGVQLSTGHSVQGQIGFVHLDQQVLPFWTERGRALPDLESNQALLHYRCAGIDLHLDTTVQERWRGSLWMISLPASVSAPQVRLATRTPMAGWFFDFRPSGRQGACLTRVVDLSTTGIRVQTEDRHLDVRPGEVLVGSLVGPHTDAGDLPLRVRVQRVAVVGGGRELACRFEHSGYKNLVRIATALRSRRDTPPRSRRRR